MVAVVEQADVPVGRHRLEEPHQGARPLRKLETEQALVRGQRRATADEVADVQLGHLIVGQVQRLETVAGEMGGDLFALALPGRLDADEDVRSLGVGDAVIELGDAAPANQCAEALQAAGPFRNRDGEDGLAVLAELGALGNEAQAVEVEVGPAGDGDDGLALEPVLLDVGLGAGHGQRAGRLEHGARILEDILGRGADVIGVHEDHSIEVLPAEPKRLNADLPHGDAVGKKAHPVEPHPTAGLEGTVHGIGIHRLDADDLHLGSHPLHVGRHAGGEATAADRHEDRMERTRVLLQDLHRDGPLPRDHIRIVERVHEREPIALGQGHRIGVGVVVGIAVQDHLGAARLDRMHLHLRGRHRHHDDRPGAEPLGGQGHALRMVAGGSADHAAGELGRRERRHFVIGAAQLEGEDALHVLAFQQEGVVEPRGEVRRLLQRRFLRHVVDAGGQDLLQVVDHGSRNGRIPPPEGWSWHRGTRMSNPIFPPRPRLQSRRSNRRPYLRLQPPRRFQQRRTIVDQVASAGDPRLDQPKWPLPVPAALAPPGRDVEWMVVLLMEKDHDVRPRRGHAGQVEFRITLGHLPPDVLPTGQGNEIVDEGESAGHARMPAKPQLGINPRPARRGPGTQFRRIGLHPRRERKRRLHLAEQSTEPADVLEDAGETVGQRQRVDRQARLGQPSGHTELDAAGHEHEIGRQRSQSRLVDPQVVTGHRTVARLHVTGAILRHAHHAVREIHRPDRLGQARHE